MNKLDIYKDLLTVHNNNTTPLISVTIDSNEENTEIWNNCISSEFPITYMDMDKYGAICQIGSPHQGYTLKASQKNDILDGEAFLYDYDNRIVANFTYQEGVANGKCKMYYRSGEIYFSGFLQEGYRNGPGVEYRKDGSVIYEGFYKNGRQAPNIKQRSDGSNYWDEKDENGRMVSMFQIDDIGLHHGICYIYYNGEISKISRWEHGKEMELLKNFNGLTMQVFKKGKEVFSGRYSKQSDFEYVPIYTTKTKSVRVSEEPLIKESVCTCRCFYKCYKRMYQVFSGIFVLYLLIWMILSFCELHEIIWPATVLFMVLFSIFTFCTFGFIFLHYVRDECALY